MFFRHKHSVATRQFEAFKILNDVIGFDVETKKDTFGSEGDLLGHAVSFESFSIHNRPEAR